MEQIEERLARWLHAGLITASQADAIRAYERARPRVPSRPPEPVPAGRRAAVPPRPQPPARRPPVRAAPDGETGPLIGGLPLAPDARHVGVVMAVLAVAGVLAGIFSVTVDLLVAPTHNIAGDLEDLLHLGASFLGVVGGIRMMVGVPRGRRLVLGSLGINLLATAVLSLHRLTQGGTLVEVAAWMALAVVVVASRFDRPARLLQG